MTKVEKNSATNPITTKSEAKISEMKSEQDKKRASLFLDVKEQYATYKEQQKRTEQAYNIYKQQTYYANQNDNNKDYKAEEGKARSIFIKERNNSDLALSILQFRTNNYTRAGRLNLLDMA